MVWGGVGGVGGVGCCGCCGVSHCENYVRVCDYLGVSGCCAELWEHYEGSDFVKQLK